MKRIYRMISVALLGIGFACQAQITPQDIILLQEGSISGQLINKKTGAPAPYCRVVLHSITTFSPYVTCDQPSLSPLPPFDAPISIDLPISGTFSYPIATTYSSEQGQFSFSNLWTGRHHYEVEIESSQYYERTITGPFSAGDNDWGVIEISSRPFFFENVFEQSNVVSAIVVNTTRSPAYMRFWLTGNLTRLDDSAYFGCNSEAPLQLKQRRGPSVDYVTYQLNPGKNPVKLRLRDYGPDIAISQIAISGGRSYSEPMIQSTCVMQRMTLPPIIGPLPPYTNIIVIPTNIVIAPFPIATNRPPGIILPPVITNLPPGIIPLPTNPPVLGPFPFPTNFLIFRPIPTNPPVITQRPKK